MKSLYSQRFEKIWKQIKSVRTTTDQRLQDEYRKYNRDLFKSSRKGRYLIIYDEQVGYKHYIYYAWKDDGYISSTSSRKDAQWFSKKEVDEFKARWGNKIKVVRR